MCTSRCFVIILTVAAGVLPLIGAVIGVLGAQVTVRKIDGLLARDRDLRLWEAANREAVGGLPADAGPEHAAGLEAERVALAAERKRLHDDGLPVSSFGTIGLEGIVATRDIARSQIGQFWLAAAFLVSGAVCGVIAGVWGLYLAPG